MGIADFELEPGGSESRYRHGNTSLQTAHAHGFGWLGFRFGSGVVVGICDQMGEGSGAHFRIQNVFEFEGVCRAVRQDLMSDERKEVLYDVENELAF